MENNNKAVKPIEFLSSGSNEFKPADHFRKYDDGGEYLPTPIQIMWFLANCEEKGVVGRCVTTVPEPDATTPGAFVSTAYVYENETLIISFSCRAKPSDTVNDDEVGMDPYELCQHRALSTALKLLGYKAPYPPESSTGEPTEDQAEADSDNASGESSTKKKRGRPKKKTEDPAAEVKASEKKDVKTEDIAATASDAATPDDAAVTANDDNSSSEPAVTPVVSNDEASEISEEEYAKASKVTVSYRTWENVPLGALSTSNGKNAAMAKKDLSFLKWIADGTKATTFFSEEQIKAAKIVYKHDHA